MFLKYWLPVLAWMLLIFFLSTDALSSGQTSGFLVPFIRWLRPDLSDIQVDRIQFVIRKGAHFAEYAILAILLWRARRWQAGPEPGGWSWSDAAWVFFAAALYGITDELHQATSVARFGSAMDVLIDSAGGAAGVLAGFWLERRRARRQRQNRKRG